MPGPRHAPLAYRAIVALLRPILMVITKRDWRGAEKIPQSGGVLICGNHISYFDPLAMAHFINDSGRQPRYIGKEEVFRIPLFGSLIKAAGQIPVRRESPDAAIAFAAAEQALRDGHCVVIYPEATITIDPDIWPLQGKSGAIRLAMRTGVPIIPVAQWGPQEVISPQGKGFRIFPRKTMQIRVGDPIDVAALVGPDPDTAAVQLAADELQMRITRLLAQIRGVPAPTELHSRAEIKEQQRREAQEPAAKKARKSS